MLGPDRVRAGDVLIAMGSSGRALQRLLAGPAGDRRRPACELSDTPAELAGRTLGEELLTPTRIYAQDCLRLIADGGVHAFSHITGGGLAGNLVRVLPAGLDAVVDRSTWSPLPIFQLLAARRRHRPRPSWSRPSTSASAWSRCSRRSRADARAGHCWPHAGVPGWRLGDGQPRQRSRYS